MTKHSEYSELAKIIEEIVLCQDCGGYVSDHQGVLGDCNYEAGQEIVDDTVTALTTLITKEKAKAELAGRIDSLKKLKKETKEQVKASENNLKYHQENTKNKTLIAEWSGAINGEQFILKCINDSIKELEAQLAKDKEDE